MTISEFGKKQKKVLNWWSKNSPDRMKCAIICDGSVRSGKTLAMTISFILWAMGHFSNTSFAICGKTIKSIRRNIVVPIISEINKFGFRVNEKISENKIEISFGKQVNHFYIFGGKDESSAALIQGMTLGGVLFDEVALMPRTFVEQAMARCSLKGSKLWFNCNPDTPEHWFYREWIKQADMKNALYLHFTMDDNPALSDEIKKRYKTLYSGVFYERFVEGKWVSVEGLVYPYFNRNEHIKDIAEPCEKYVVSCDYGTVNPMSIGLWGLKADKWYRLDEYYFDSKTEAYMKTDEEYYIELENLIDGRNIEMIIVDPSAASFIECINRHSKYMVKKADNNVLDGIRKTADALKHEKIYISPACTNSIRELSLYRWSDNINHEKPLKLNDHAMDDIRYFVATYLMKSVDEAFFVEAVRRE